MVKEFNNLEEIEKYYDKKTNTYVFKDIYLVIFKFNLDVECNIKANNINAWDINAWDINAWDINAGDINYYAVCFADNNIFCKSIVGKRENSRHFCLDGKITIKE